MPSDPAAESITIGGAQCDAALAVDLIQSASGKMREYRDALDWVARDIRPAMTHLKAQNKTMHMKIAELEGELDLMRQRQGEAMAQLQATQTHCLALRRKIEVLEAALEQAGTHIRTCTSYIKRLATEMLRQAPAGNVNANAAALLTISSRTTSQEPRRQ